MEDKSKFQTFQVATPIGESPTKWKLRKRDLPVHERDGLYLVIIAGCLMSMQAGFINVISILKTGITISHNTGTSSKLGISFGGYDIPAILHGCGLILSFVFGGVLVGFFIRKHVFHVNRKYGFFLITEAFLLYLFKFSLDENMPNIAVIFGSFACGVQNALLTNLSGSVVRTTHMTGLMTDTGLIIGNYIRGREQCKDLWRLKVLIPIIISFIFGAFMSKILYSILDYSAIMISVYFIGISGSIIVLLRLIKKYQYSKFKNLKTKLLGGKEIQTTFDTPKV